jgi:hypothetical protein
VRRWIARLLIALAIAETAWLAYPVARQRILALEETPAARGQRIAPISAASRAMAPEAEGHREPRQRGRPRAGIHERTQMMYVKTADDLR